MKTMKLLHRLFGKEDESLNSICCSKAEFRSKLKIERSRTHRNSHEFSLVTFNLKTLELNKKQVRQMIKTIHSRIRDIDTLGWYDKENIGIILPYTTSQGAKEFSNSIIDFMNEYKQESQYSLITYPPENNKNDDKDSKQSLLRSV